MFCQKDRRTIIESDECWVQRVNTIYSNESLTAEENKELQLIIQKNRQVASKKSSANWVSVTKWKWKLHFKRPSVANIVKDLLKNEIVRKLSCPYVSGIVLVEKRNGELRLCIDYMQLNQITVHYEFNSMPFGLVNAPAIFQQFHETRRSLSVTWRNNHQ